MYYFGWKFRIFRDRVFLTILLILKSSRCFILFITNKVIVNTLLHPISIEMLLDRTKKWSNLRKEDLYRGNHVLVLDCFVVQSLSRVQLCDLMDCNTPGFPVLHHLLEFVQTHVHWKGDAIQPSCPVIPFSSCLQSSPASGSFPMSWFFTSGGQSIEASASVLPMNIQSWFPLGLTGLILQS